MAEPQLSKTELMELFEKATGLNAIWQNKVTNRYKTFVQIFSSRRKDFKKLLKGEQTEKEKESGVWGAIDKWSDVTDVLGTGSILGTAKDIFGLESLLGFTAERKEESSTDFEENLENINSNIGNINTEVGNLSTDVDNLLITNILNNILFNTQVFIDGLEQPEKDEMQEIFYRINNILYNYHQDTIEIIQKQLLPPITKIVDGGNVFKFRCNKEVIHDFTILQSTLINKIREILGIALEPNISGDMVKKIIDNELFVINTQGKLVITSEKAQQIEGVNPGEYNFNLSRLTTYQFTLLYIQLISTDRTDNIFTAFYNRDSRNFDQCNIC